MRSFRESHSVLLLLSSCLLIYCFLLCFFRLIFLCNIYRCGGCYRSFFFACFFFFFLFLNNGPLLLPFYSRSFFFLHFTTKWFFACRWVACFVMQEKTHSVCHPHQIRRRNRSRKNPAIIMKLHLIIELNLFINIFFIFSIILNSYWLTSFSLTSYVCLVLLVALPFRYINTLYIRTNFHLRFDTWRVSFLLSID